MKKTKKYELVSGADLLAATAKLLNMAVAKGFPSSFLIGDDFEGEIMIKDVIACKNAIYRFVEAVVFIGGLEDNELRARLNEKFGLIGDAYYWASNKGKEYPSYKSVLWILLKMLSPYNYGPNFGESFTP